MPGEGSSVKNFKRENAHKVARRNATRTPWKSHLVPDFNIPHDWVLCTGCVRIKVKKKKKYCERWKHDSEKKMIVLIWRSTMYILTSFSGPDLSAWWLWRPITNPEAVGSNPDRGTRLEVFIYRSISPPTPGARKTTVRTQGGGGCVYGVKKSLGINKIIRKHLIQMFHCSMEECGSAASEVQCI